MEAELAEVATAKAEAERRLAEEEESRLAEVNSMFLVLVSLEVASHLVDDPRRKRSCSPRPGG
jgi:hypothetical protein